MINIFYVLSQDHIGDINSFNACFLATVQNDIVLLRQRVVFFFFFFFIQHSVDSNTHIRKSS